MGRVLGRHAMLHGRPEVDVEYGEEELAVDSQGDEDKCSSHDSRSCYQNVCTCALHIHLIRSTSRIRLAVQVLHLKHRSRNIYVLTKAYETKSAANNKLPTALSVCIVKLQC